MNVRKISLGIFAILTAMLFILSMVPSVTATTHDFHPVDMYSAVGKYYPWEFAETLKRFEEQDWDIQIVNGDTVRIKTTCYWSHTYPWDIYPYQTLTGIHIFYFEAWYDDTMYEPTGDNPIRKDTSSPTQDSFEWEVDIPNCQGDTYIYVYWLVKTRHVEGGPEYTEASEDGYIYLYN